MLTVDAQAFRRGVSATRSTACATAARTSNGARSICSLPDSIFDRSRMSLIVASSSRPLERMVSASSRCCGVERRVGEQIGHPEHAVHRRADLVAHVGEELALGAASPVRRARWPRPAPRCDRARAPRDPRASRPARGWRARGHRAPCAGAGSCRRSRATIASRSLAQLPHFERFVAVRRPRRRRAVVRRHAAGGGHQPFERTGDARRRGARRRQRDDETERDPRRGGEVEAHHRRLDVADRAPQQHRPAERAARRRGRSGSAAGSWRRRPTRYSNRRPGSVERSHGDCETSLKTCGARGPAADSTRPSASMHHHARAVGQIAAARPTRCARG